MPSVAVDPHDASHLVIAHMDYSLVTSSYAGIGVAVSHDSGTTWQDTSVPLPDDFDQGAAWPVAHFDAQGHVFISFMAATFLGPQPALTNGNFEDRGVPGIESNNGIFVARSDDGGLTWQQPVAVVSHLYDGQNPVFFECIPDLAIDTFRALANGQPNPNYGNQYVVWTRVYPPGQFPGEPTATGGTDLMVAVSRDGGQSYQTQLENVPGIATPVTVIQDPLAAQLGGMGAPPGFGFQDQGHVTVGPEGDIYITSYGVGDFVVYHSTDGGASFTFPTHSNDLNLAFGNAENTYVNESGLPTNNFRTFPPRQIVADPSRPGYVYAAAAIFVFDQQGNQIDAADIIFARSTDHGVHWTSAFQVGSTPNATTLNDDNGGHSATGLTPDQVISGQAMPEMAVDSHGNISVIWYDTRHDPANHLLDVSGTTSTDGGLTFTPNLRLTNQSFDANQGVFTDATGQPNYYLGDAIGLALANNTAYAAWTGTRAGNQDIYFTTYPIGPAPAPPNDRYESNDTAATATDLGQKKVQLLVPKLALPAGDEDWFRVRAAATGNLTVSAQSDGNIPLPASRLQLQLWDDTGTNLLATGSDLQNAAGHTLGQNLAYPSNAGQSFLVRVFRSNPANTDPISYVLGLQSLTADLGTRAVADVRGALGAGGEALYRLTAAAAGSLQVQFTNGANVQGNLNVQVLAPDTFAVLSDPPPRIISAAGPNQSIPEATPTGLVGPGSVQVAGDIGDGPFGTTSGDYNFYSLAAAAGQRIEAALVDPPGSGLDGVIVLYDSAGNLLQLVDNHAPGLGEFLSFVTTKADTYYVVIYGSTSTDAPPTDPFTPGTGGGLPSHPGPYSLTITVRAIGPGAVQQAAVPVQQGQTVLLQVTGEGDSAGDYGLTITNLDQFTTPENASLVFPAGAGPSQVAVGDLTGSGIPDLVVADSQSNTVSVLLGNGDDTFQAPRQYAIGSFKFPSAVFVANGQGDFRRQVALTDLTGNGKLDIVVTNYDSGDVSVLLNRGDGTFEPQRRFDATSAPFGLAIGDLNSDRVPDLVAIDSEAAQDSTVAVLLGRGDGTFEPEQTFPAKTGGAFPVSSVTLADLNHDGKLDLIVHGGGPSEIEVFWGNGDGTFRPGVLLPASRLAAGLAVADINGDGIPDIVTTALDPSGVGVLLGNGDGTFTPLVNPDTNGPLFPAGQSPVALALADFGSQVTQPDGSVTLGPPDGHPDLLVAASGAIFANAPQEPTGTFIIPTLWDAQGQFTGLGVPQLLAPGQPLDVTTADLTGKGTADVIAVDQTGVRVIFGKRPTIPPNDTPQTARNLGTVVHLLEPALTIVPGHTDAFYTLTVPTEDAPGSGNEVPDFSGLFQATEGAGLSMEVRDAAGNLLGSGERFRVVAPQGAVLTLHVFGVTGPDGSRGAGAYTLDIDTLPQLVSVEAQPLLPGRGGAPGGPTASLVLTFQGDRLDPDTAQVPNNYTVTWLGPDGIAGTADDQVIPIQGVVYDPSSNVDVASGKTYPTAVRQTVTLLFDQALPAGSYLVTISPAVQAAAFSADEAGLLTAVPGFTDHALVSVAQGRASEGDRQLAADLVFAAGALGDLAVWNAGTPFLSQFHDDLGALLDAQLTALGDDPTISGAIDSQIVDRVGPALGPAEQRPVGVLVVWLDPVSPTLIDPQHGRIAYDLQDNSLVNTFRQGFVSVVGNVELLVLPFLPVGVQSDLLTVAQVPPTARGGAVYLGRDGADVLSLTAALRQGTTSFLLTFGTPAAAGPPAAAAEVAPAPLPLPPPPAPAAQGTAPVAPTLSSAAALAALPTRTETATVTPLTLLPRSAAPEDSSGQPGGAGASVPARGAGNGGGGGGAPNGPGQDDHPPWPTPGDLGALLEKADSWLRAVLKALAGPPRGKDKDPAPEPPGAEAAPPQQPPGDEAELPADAPDGTAARPAEPFRGLSPSLAALASVAAFAQASATAAREGGRRPRRRRGQQEGEDG
jgi:hypothetical protein